MKALTTSVYWNLHAERQGDPVWSVLQSGKKVQHFKSLTIRRPRTHIQEKKYLKASVPGAKRELCAFIKGELEIYQAFDGRPFQYNPQKSHDFYFTDNGDTMSGEFELASFSIDANNKPVTTIR